MSDRITDIVSDFLKENLKSEKSFLLGLSGGADSLALFYVLLECRKNLPFSFGVAHVDHGWREESSGEAAILRDLAAKHSLPFYLHVIENEAPSRNLEAIGRERRLSFFSELCRKHHYQAVMLGHHSDDQAETVLKNIFEGAHLCSSNGMTSVNVLEDLRIWRPLLTVNKEELKKWLQERGLVPFIDETNFDPRFLRARMRTEIFPYLEETFGKRIKRSLASFGKESQELRIFMQEHLAPVLDKVSRGSLGSFIDLSKYETLSSFEMKCIIRELCQKEQCFPSREIVDDVAHQLMKKSANKRFFMGQHMICADRMRLFVARPKFEEIPQGSVAVRDRALLGGWEVRIERTSGAPCKNTTDWRDLWRGKAEVYLPLRDVPYQLGPPVMSHSYPRSSPLSKWWNDHKIPAFLRHMTPVIWSGDSIAHEFLSGKKRNISDENDRWEKISLLRSG